MALLNLIGAAILSPSLGATGICISVFIAYFVRTIGMDFIFQKEMKINFFFFFKETFIKLTFPMILCLVAGWAINTFISLDNWTGFLVKGVFFCFCYIIISYTIAMNDYERGVILSPIKRFIKQ